MKEITPEIQEWLNNNPEVGTLCRKGEIVFYIMDRSNLNEMGFPTMVEIEPFDDLLRAEVNPIIFFQDRPKQNPEGDDLQANLEETLFE